MVRGAGAVDSPALRLPKDSLETSEETCKLKHLPEGGMHSNFL